MPLAKPFFDSVRETVTNGRLSARQVDGLNHIWAEWERRELTDLRWAANILAQSFWESDRTWQPILESGGPAYLQSKRYYPYIGAGLIQVTWRANYQKFGASKPKDLLSWPIALRALFDGMIDGMFTGKKLADFFNETTDDSRGARQIVNGNDRDVEIAAIHRKIYAALTRDGAIVTAEPPRDVEVGTNVLGGAAVAWAALQIILEGKSPLAITMLVGAIMVMVVFKIIVSRRETVEITPPSEVIKPRAIDPIARFETAKKALKAASIEMNEAIQGLQDKKAEIDKLSAGFEFKLIEHEAAPPQLEGSTEPLTSEDKVDG